MSSNHRREALMANCVQGDDSSAVRVKYRPTLMECTFGLDCFFFLVFGDQGIDTRGFKNTSPWTRQTQLCVWQRFDTVGLDLNAEWTRVSIVFCSIPIEMLSRSSFWPLEYFLIAFSRSVFVEELCELRAWFNLFLARWRQNCRNPTFPVYRSFS